MKYFYIITNKTKDPGFVTTNDIKNYLMKRGKVCYIHEEPVVLHCDTVEEADFSSEDTNPFSAQTRVEDIPPEVECIIVLGGDGTLLRAARNLVKLNIPFLGVNLGTLGYLTEGDKNSLTDILERVIADEYILEKRMMLVGKVFDPEGKLMAEDVALNDLTVNRSRSLRIFKFKLYVNGEFLYLYTADGIIVSTPTGSTAYNLSCGGPVVEPTAKLFLVTPIAPHSLNNRSLILSSTDKIELEIIGSDKDYGSEVEYVAYFDGDSKYVLRPGCRIQITKSRHETQILKLSSMSFLDTLRIKMS